MSVIKIKVSNILAGISQWECELPTFNPPFIVSVIYKIFLEM